MATEQVLQVLCFRGRVGVDDKGRSRFYGIREKLGLGGRAGQLVEELL